MSDARRPRARRRPLSDEEAMALAGAMIAQTRAAWRRAQGLAVPATRGPWLTSAWRRIGRHLGAVTMPAPLAACAELSIIAVLAMTAIGGLVCERMA